MSKPSNDQRIREHLVVMRAQIGDREAHASLFEIHNGALRYFVRRLLRDPEEAEDALQETWLSVVRRLAALKDPGSFRAWLYRVARNHCHMRMRREPVESELDTEQLAGMDIEPDLQLIQKHDASLVHAALERLSLSQREVLTLRFLEELSYAEIAEVVQCSIGTVRSRMHYGKQAMLAWLNTESGHNFDQHNELA